MWTVQRAQTVMCQRVKHKVRLYLQLREEFFNEKGERCSHDFGGMVKALCEVL